jgi:hypothetical protein
MRSNLLPRCAGSRALNWKSRSQSADERIFDGQGKEVASSCGFGSTEFA